MGIPIKTEEEITIMRKGGKILANVLEQVCKKAAAGISTYELDQFAEELILSSDATPTFKGYHDFPAALCTCRNDVIVHGIPKKNDILEEGDLFTVDCGVHYKGLNTDAARSIAIGKTSEKKQKLIKKAYEILEKVENLLKPGLPVNEIGRLIEKEVIQAGYNVIHDLTGHGVGRQLHEKPMILNYYEGRPGPKLLPGMTLAIEPIFAIGTSKMKTLSDGWTITTVDHSPSVQVENTFLITQNGVEALTKT